MKLKILSMCSAVMFLCGGSVFAKTIYSGDYENWRKMSVKDKIQRWENIAGGNQEEVNNWINLLERVKLRLKDINKTSKYLLNEIHVVSQDPNSSNKTNLINEAVAHNNNCSLSINDLEELIRWIESLKVYIETNNLPFGFQVNPNMQTTNVHISMQNTNGTNFPGHQGINGQGPIGNTQTFNKPQNLINMSVPNIAIQPIKPQNLMNMPDPIPMQTTNGTNFPGHQGINGQGPIGNTQTFNKPQNLMNMPVPVPMQNTTGTNFLGQQDTNGYGQYNTAGMNFPGHQGTNGQRPMYGSATGMNFHEHTPMQTTNGTNFLGQQDTNGYGQYNTAGMNFPGHQGTNGQGPMYGNATGMNSPGSESIPNTQGINGYGYGATQNTQQAEVLKQWKDEVTKYKDTLSQFWSSLQGYGVKHKTIVKQGDKCLSDPNLFNSKFLNSSMLGVAGFNNPNELVNLWNNAGLLYSQARKDFYRIRDMNQNQENHNYEVVLSDLRKTVKALFNTLKDLVNILDNKQNSGYINTTHQLTYV